MIRACAITGSFRRDHLPGLPADRQAGTSSLQRNIENRVTLLTEPGDSLSLSAYSFTNSGVIHIAGTNVVTTYFNFTQTPSGKLEFDLAGTAPGVTHGQLRIGGQGTLEGVLKASLIAPYSPISDDSFELLTWQSTTGTFSTIAAPPLPAGLQFTPEYQAKSFRLKTSINNGIP